jgi:hypothetical protein
VVDPNWFFSSFAQAIAALVGVLAAFVIARLITNQSDFGRKAARTAELIADSDRLRALARPLRISGYNQHTFGVAMEALRREVANKTIALASAEDYYSRLDFPPYEPRVKMLAAIALVVEAEAQQRKGAEGGVQGARVLESEEAPRLATNPIANPQFQSDFLRAGTRSDLVSQEGRLIEKHWIDVQHQIRQIEAHLSAVSGNPESSAVVGWALVAILLLFWSGVIYPLSLLPLPTNRESSLSVHAFVEILESPRTILLAIASPHGTLVTIATVIFSFLICYLWYQNWALRYPKSDVESLAERRLPAEYSTYFDIRAENERGPHYARPGK